MEGEGVCYARQYQNSGRPKILPSSHTGSDRYMYKKYEDGMAIVREKGKPQLFITMTMNPQCKAMMAQLKPGQIPYDRPDILCRAFKIMNDAILDEIIKKQLFGEVEAYLTTIEFQKSVGLLILVLSFGLRTLMICHMA